VDLKNSKNKNYLYFFHSFLIINKILNGSFNLIYESAWRVVGCQTHLEAPNRAKEGSFPPFILLSLTEKFKFRNQMIFLLKNLKSFKPKPHYDVL